jgi:drug/metabolite transporter (DMT)-like permease
VNWRGPVYLSLAAAIWGGMYVVTRQVLVVISVPMLLEIRFVLAGVVLGVLAWARHEGHVAPRDLVRLAGLGLVGFTGSIGLQFIGTYDAGAAMGSLVTASAPALIVGLAAWWLKERVTGTQIAGLAAAVVGLVVLVGIPAAPPGPRTAIGNAALVGAAVTWAVYTVQGRMLTRRYSALSVTAWVSWFGVLFTMPWWVLTPHHYAWVSHPAVWAAIGYVGLVSTAGAFFLWNLGFMYIDASRGALFMFVQPVVGTLLAWTLLGEPLSWSLLAGGVLIAVGLGLSSREPVARPQDLPDGECP